MMYGGGKSDPGVVAVKPANNAEQSAAESVEPRTGTKGNADQQSTRQAQDWERVSQALARIRQAAKLRKKERFTSLLHHVSIDLLRVSFFALKKDAAPGVDGLAWRDYETRLESQRRFDFRPKPPRTIASSTAGVRKRRGRCWKPSGRDLRIAGLSFIQRRPRSSTARTMIDGERTRTSSSTSSAIPSNLGERRTGGESTSSASCRPSV